MLKSLDVALKSTENREIPGLTPGIMMKVFFRYCERLFYNTLAAISNDFNWDKYNYCRVVSPEELILEEMDVIIMNKGPKTVNLERQEA